MRIIVLIILSITLCFTSDIRINSLGGNSLYWDNDDEIINIFPSRVKDFNIFQVSGIDSSVQSSYIKYVWGDETKYGLFVPSNNQGFSLLYGNNNFGLRTDIDFSYSQVDTLNENIVESKILNLGLTLGKENISGSIATNTKDIELGINYIRDISFMGFEHFYTGFQFYNDFDSDNDAILSSRFLLDFWRHFKNIPDIDILLAVSSSVNYNKFDSIELADSVNTNISFIFPDITLGFESKIRDWLAFRVGIEKSFMLSSNHSIYSNIENEIFDIKSIKFEENDLLVSFGFGFLYKGFMLDLGINGEVFQNPIQKLVGFDDLGANTSASISYSW